MATRPLTPSERDALLDSLGCQTDRVRSGLACATCEGTSETVAHDCDVWWFVRCVACRGTGQIDQPKGK